MAGDPELKGVPPTSVPGGTVRQMEKRQRAEEVGF